MFALLLTATLVLRMTELWLPLWLSSSVKLDASHLREKTKKSKGLREGRVSAPPYGVILNARWQYDDRNDRRSSRRQKEPAKRG